MRVHHVASVVVAGSIVTLVACGGNIESSCGNYFDSLNALAQQCGSTNLFDPSSRANFLLDCDALVKAPGTGNLSSEIDSCVNKIKSASCDSSALQCPARGTLTDGTHCATSVQCAGGVCDTSGSTPTSTSEVVCGACAQYVAIGGDCTKGSCDSLTSTCSQNKCVAYIQSGGACGTTTPGSCAPGLQCDPKSTTCQAYPAKGQSCTLTCEAPYRCISGTCADGVAQGGACPTGFECAPNLTCDPQGKTCQPTKQAQAGQACGFVNGQIVSCVQGTNCTQGTCTAPKGSGAACTVGNHECASFLVCISGTCQIPDYTVCK